jgi:hypothetical protein
MSLSVKLLDRSHASHESYSWINLIGGCSDENRKTFDFIPNLQINHKSFSIALFQILKSNKQKRVHHEIDVRALYTVSKGMQF